MNHELNVEHLLQKSEVQSNMKLREPMRSLFKEIIKAYGKHCYEQGLAKALLEKKDEKN